VKFLGRKVTVRCSISGLRRRGLNLDKCLVQYTTCTRILKSSQNIVTLASSFVYELTKCFVSRVALCLDKRRPHKCLSGASWSALRSLASVRSNEARRGVNGFGPFCRNKRASPAGAKPGNTENHVDLRVGFTGAMRSPLNAFLLANPNMDSRHTS